MTTRLEDDQPETGPEATAAADTADGTLAPQSEDAPSSPDNVEETGVAQDGDTDESDPSPARAEEAAAEAELDTEAARVQSEMASLHDRHLRLAAEFDNYRRRAQSEMSESWVRAQADLVRSLLEPLDDLRRVSALDLSSATVETIMEGIDLVERNVMRALKDAGLEDIDPEGQAFDPNIMEAMMRVPAETLEEDDMVHQVFQKGYTLKGHLVRPARVSVLKHD